MDHNEISEADAQEVEACLLRAVYENARTILRFHGVDAQRVTRAFGELDMNVERVKLFDGGLWDVDGVNELLNGRSFISRVYQICSAYESGYGHGLQLDGFDNREGGLHCCPRCDEAYKIGYRKGAALAQAQSRQPDVLQRERERHQAAAMLAQQVVLDAIPVPQHLQSALDRALGLEEFVLRLPKQVADLYCEQAKAYGVIPMAVVRQVVLNASLGEIMAAAAQVADPTLSPLPPISTHGGESVASAC